MLVYLDLDSKRLDPVLDYIQSNEISVVAIYPVIHQDQDLYLVVVDVPAWQGLWLKLLAAP